MSREMSNKKPYICILGIYEQYKVPQKEDERTSVLYKLLTWRLSVREKVKDFSFDLTRGRRDQDALLLKIKLDKKWRYYSSHSSILYYLSLK